jgi:hypothetical protein
MFINTGARSLLLQGERQKFLAEEWPRVHATIQRLGITPEDLLKAAPVESRPPSAVQDESKPNKSKDEANNETNSEEKQS